MPARRHAVRCLAIVGIVVVATPARSAPMQCHVVDVTFVPSSKLQIVGWIEDAAGNYVDTIYITQTTGTYGLGNRPGNVNFNSGPNWPYGRRVTVFPVWAHRHGMTFPEVVFQDGIESNVVGGPFSQSSQEPHYCRPLQPPPSADTAAWDAASCPSIVFTDKGTFEPSGRTSLYPPRVDLVHQSGDSSSVNQYAALDPWDAVSQATPPGGTPATITWTAPSSLPAGSYVAWIEASAEFDFNATYSPSTMPTYSGPFSLYGLPYLGQPSVVYRVPFTLGATESITGTTSYAGYGDPSGGDGVLRVPDATITTTTPGSGASRLQLVSANGSMYRVLVDAHPEPITIPPAAPMQLQATAETSTSLSLAFAEPAAQSAITSYEARIRAGSPMTDANFASSNPVATNLQPHGQGFTQAFDVPNLLPETDYWIGVRGFDVCHNPGAIAIVHVRTAARTTGDVDACFIATAAYGSVMADDVALLRHFRDAALHGTVLGELAIETYYTFGPVAAGVVGESDLLRSTARAALAPLVRFVGTLSF